MKWVQAGRRIVMLAVSLFLLFGLVPIGPNLLVWLETQYAKPSLPPGIDGIIVLGGMFDTDSSEQTRQLVSNDNMERMTAFIELARAHPEAKLVFSGGAGTFPPTERKEADMAQAYFRAIGFDDIRVIYERQSRNTHENAVLSKEVAQPAPGELWVLVTSAAHMRRAVATFAQAGWRVIAYPVDPGTGLAYDWRLWPLAVGRNFNALEEALKEIIGYQVYKLSGKSV